MDRSSKKKWITIGGLFLAQALLIGYATNNVESRKAEE